MNKIILFSFIFALSELLLSFVKRSAKGTAKKRKDKGSLIILWVVITLGFTGAFFLSGQINPIWLGFGAAFLIPGIVIRWLAILQLGQSFTVDVAITETASLRTDGIYKNIRHPSYLGILMIVTGFSAAMNSLYSFLILVVPVFLAIIYRISVEEDLLLSEFGENYSEYMKNTKKLIPRVY